jgi:hypothetical protein
VLAAIGLGASVAHAEVSTDLSGTVVVYPKVIWDSTRDTVIQLTNTSNNLVHAKCFYINAAPSNPNLPPGPNNPPRWQVTDFELWLTRQQPTHWVASQGRPVNPNDGFGEDGSGLDAGAVPPVPTGFTGELKCVQTEASGMPFGGNALKGEALLRDDDGDVSKYNAVSILATSEVADDNRILLDNNPSSSDAEGDGEEANSCHQTLLLNHFADSVDDPVADAEGICLEDGCPIRTELTLVPCSQDLENVEPGRVTVQLAITNELEQNFSASITVDCWLNQRLGDVAANNGTCSLDDQQICQDDQDCFDGSDGFCIKQGPFSATVLGTLTAYTRITPVDLDGGVIGVAEETHSLDDEVLARAAWDLQAEGNFINGRWFPITRYEATIATPGGPVVDEIVIPEF